RTYFYSKLIDRLILGYFYRLADKIICVSHVCADDAQAYLNLPQEKLTVIYNPVLPENLSELQQDMSGQVLVTPKAKPLLLSIGRLEHVKDQKTLIRAFKIVREKTEATLVILGEGLLREELTSLINELQLQ